VVIEDETRGRPRALPRLLASGERCGQVGGVSTLVLVRLDLALDHLLPGLHRGRRRTQRAQALGSMVDLVRTEDAPATILERIAVEGRRL
jgi:hypothetical protein